MKWRNETENQLVIKFRSWWTGPDKVTTANSPWNIIKAGYQIVFIIGKWIWKFHHTCSQRKTTIIHHVNFAAKSTATMSKYSTVSMCFVRHVSRNFLSRTLSFAHNADGECVLENKELTDCHLMSSMIEWKTYKPVISGFNSDATHSAGRCKQLQNPLTREDSVLLFSWMNSSPSLNGKFNCNYGRKCSIFCTSNSFTYIQKMKQSETKTAQARTMKFQ